MTNFSKTRAGIITLLFLFISLAFAVPPADPGIITTIDSCVSSANGTGHIAMGTGYFAECEFKDGLGDRVDNEQFAVHVIGNTGGALRWHTQLVRDECLAQYAGDEFGEGCYYLTKGGGSGVVRFNIDPSLFTPGNVYNVTMHADEASSAVFQFNVTDAHLVEVSKNVNPDLGEEYYYTAHAKRNVIDFNCDAYLLDGSNLERHLGEFNVSNSDDFTVKDSSFGLRMYHNYTLLVECSNGLTVNETVRVGVTDAVNEGARVGSNLLNYAPIILIAGILLALFAWFGFTFLKLIGVRP